MFNISHQKNKIENIVNLIPDKINKECIKKIINYKNYRIDLTQNILYVLKTKKPSPQDQLQSKKLVGDSNNWLLAIKTVILQKFALANIKSAIRLTWIQPTIMVGYDPSLHNEFNYNK